MKIFTKHIFREFSRPFFFLIVVFAGLSVISDFFRDLGMLLERKTPASSVISYLALTNIHKAFQLLPIAALVATLFSVGQMARSGELTAVKVAGNDIRRSFVPFFFAGLVLSLAVFMAVFFIVPPLVSKGYEIKRTDVMGLPPRESGVRWAVSMNVPPAGKLQASVLDADGGYIGDAIYYEYDDMFRLRRQIVARRIEWTDERWKFINGVERDFVDDLPVAERPFDEYFKDMSVSPDDFVFGAGNPEEMTFSEHSRKLRSLQKLGLPARREAVSFHYRIASSASNFVVLFIGVYFAATVSARHGKVFGFVVALVMAFLYYGVSALGQSLGENAILSPFAAAWMGNIIFGAAGVRLFFKIPS
jgi:lipopolysaccharide export system permease protein